MPYRKKATENPQEILRIWREERSYRVGKAMSYSGIALALVATIVDIYWSPFAVILTDLVLLCGCALSLYWIKADKRPEYYWWPFYFGFWISILPSLWTTGGINSPFIGVDLVALYVIGSVMEKRNRSLFYLFFALLHLPVFYYLENFYPLSASGTPPIEFSVIVTTITLAAVFICIHAMLRTERELSLEFAGHYQNLVQTEEELKKSEAQLREAQSIADIGSWEWNIEKDFVSWSGELFRIFEIEKKDFDPSFQAYIKRLNPDVREAIQKTIQNSLVTGEDYVFENKLESSRGSRSILSRGRVVRDNNGKIIKMVGTCQDITDRKYIESQLEEARHELEKRVEERTLELAQSLEREKAAKELAESASQAKMQFLANMSHEIRTPMNSILGFSELLANTELSSNEGKEFLNRIRTNGTQLLHLIDDILDLSKFEAGQIPIHKSNFSFKSLMDDVISSFEPALKSKGIELQLFYQNEIASSIYTDAHRLRQILTNLLSNAIKFSQAGFVKINVGYRKLAEDSTSSLLVDVEDTGIGISPEHQQNLFQPFCQGDSSIARKFGGSGLGLVLSKRIAEALGGKLELKKSVPGVGTHFCFHIPAERATIEQDKKNVIKNEPYIEKDDMELENRKILLAEDSADNAFLICHYVKSLGAKIDVATDGLQAVKMASEGSYDCILMDIQMPGMDGLEATRRIRSLGFKKPIIALTAHALPAETERSLQAGCDLHLTKPINKADLMGTLNEHLKPLEV